MSCWKRWVLMFAIGHIVCACSASGASDSSSVGERAIQSLTAELVISPEIPVEAPVALPRSPGSQIAGPIAAGTRNSLAVWLEYASGQTFFRIFAARIARGGTLLDPAGIALGFTATSFSGDLADNVAVGFDGTNYLVTWGDVRNQATAQTDIYAARVSQDGVVLDPGGFPVAHSPDYDAMPAISFDGTHYLVAWQSFEHYGNLDFDSNLYAARVSPAGTVLDATPILISDAPEGPVNVQLVFDGQNHWAVWYVQASAPINAVALPTRAARISPSGVVLDPAGIEVGAGSEPHVAFDGTHVLVAWSEFPYSAFGQFLNRDGSVFGQRFPIATTDVQSLSALAFDGANYLAAFWRLGATNETKFVRVSPSGVPLDSTPLPLFESLNSRPPHLTFNGSDYVAVSTVVNPGAGDTDAYGIRISPAGIAEAPGSFVVSRGVNRQIAPAIATANRQNAMLVWSDIRDSEGVLGGAYGVRISGHTVLDAPAHYFGTSFGTQDELPSSPSVASDGENYLVAWSMTVDALGEDVVAARVSADGTVLDPGLIVVARTSEIEQHPHVAFGAGNYLVVWDSTRFEQRIDFHGNPTTVTVRELKAKRISPAGVVLDSAPLAPGAPLDPAIAFIRSSTKAGAEGTFILVGPGGESGGSVFANLFSSAGFSLGGVTVSPFSYDGTVALKPAIASDGNQALVVWQQGPSYQSTPRGDIYGARITADGTVLDPNGILIAATDAFEASPAVTFNGRHFLAAWAVSADYRDLGVRGAWISSAGKVLESGVPLLPAGSPIHSLALASHADGRTVLAYSRFSPAPEHVTDRVFFHDLTCLTAADCLKDPVPSCQIAHGTNSGRWAVVALSALLLLVTRIRARTRAAQSAFPADS